jgi:hypothetical protein
MANIYLTVRLINQTAIYDSGMTMEKHLRFKECLDSFVNSLPSNSEHHINDIIVRSYIYMRICYIICGG